MAISTSIMQLQTPVAAGGSLSAANANRDGTGTLVTLYTAGANGGRVDMVRAKAKGDTTAGMVRVYLSTDAGATKRLIAELVVAAVTVAADVAGWEGEWVPSRPLVVPAAAVLYASTHNAEGINVFGLGGDY